MLQADARGDSQTPSPREHPSNADRWLGPASSASGADSRVPAGNYTDPEFEVARKADFQFCDTVVNYDLPWNPMKVEQRIGRLDRFGQESEAISIISFVLADTVEERILLRLYDRIRVFEESIGDLEPILGPIVSDLERDVFRSHLTPEEEEARGRALDLAIETGRRELESFSQRMDEFLGTDELIAEVQERGDRGLTVTSRDVREAVGAVADRHGAVLRESRFPGIWDLADAKGLSDALRRFGVDKHLTFNDEQEELVQRLSRGRAGLM
ncbi:MAG: hypothetical protein LC118_17845, partial [Dehalococcoidia bacterium]|nr:hypothetical protein [Dehalococcoidia bacterium]